jgi:hypothetical protein
LRVTFTILVACGGFLIAVLWMDLMFDVQVLRKRDDVLPGPVLDSIAAYYRRVTTEASPMGRLVGVVMATGIATAIVQLAIGPARWVSALSLLLCAPPVVLPARHAAGHARDPDATCARDLPQPPDLSGGDDRPHRAPAALGALARNIHERPTANRYGLHE